MRSLRRLIRAARLKGDVDLGLEATRLDGQGEKSWAQMQFPGRRLPGKADQSIYAAVASTDQRFELGTRRTVYGRTFRYAKAGRAITTLGPKQRLLANANFVPDAASHEDEDGFYGNLKSTGEVGDLYVDLDEAGAARAINYYQGGYFFNFNGVRHGHYIVASDVSTATYTRIYLDEALTVEIGTGLGVEVHLSPYSNVIDLDPSAGYAGYVSFVGMMHLPALTTGQWFWLQTQGPVWITPLDWSTNLPGYASNDRDVYAHIDGTVRKASTTGIYQRVGYLLAATEALYGSVYIMLQLE